MKHTNENIFVYVWSRVDDVDDDGDGALCVGSTRVCMFAFAAKCKYKPHTLASDTAHIRTVVWQRLLRPKHERFVLLCGEFHRSYWMDYVVSLCCVCGLKRLHEELFTFEHKQGKLRTANRDARCRQVSGMETTSTTRARTACEHTCERFDNQDAIDLLLLLRLRRLCDGCDNDDDDDDEHVVFMCCLFTSVSVSVGQAVRDS